MVGKTRRDKGSEHKAYTHSLLIILPQTKVLVADEEDGGPDSSSLAILPTKFRKLIWVKRGDFLIVSGTSHDFLTAAGEKGKVKFMVEHILYKEQVKHLKEAGLWPAAFADAVVVEGPGEGGKEEGVEEEEEEKQDGGQRGARAAAANVQKKAGRIAGSTRGEGEGGEDEDEESDYESEEEDYSDLHVNTNRLAKAHLYVDDDEDEDESEDEEGDEEEEA